MPKLSYEWLAATLDRGVLFTDLRRLPEKSWLSGAFVAAPVGLMPEGRTWRLSVDAFLYLQNAEPDYIVCSE